MEVLRFDDARTFLERAMSLLAPDTDGEARHNLMIGIARSVADHPGLYSVFRAWLAIDDGEPLVAAPPARRRSTRSSPTRSRRTRSTR